MNYQDYIYQILGFVGLPALFALYLTERVKGSVRNTFDQKLEEIKYKNAKEIEDVKNEHLREISQFQSELNYLKSKDNFKFTKLHEKRLLVLEKTYMHLNKTSESLTLYVNSFERILGNINYGNNEDEILSNKFIKEIEDFSLYFNQNAIYFDVTLGNLLRDFFKESLEIFTTFQNKKRNNEVGSLFFVKEFNDKLFPIKNQIELKFRELLGE